MNSSASITEFSKRVTNSLKDSFKIAKNQAGRNFQNHKYGKIYITT